MESQLICMLIVFYLLSSIPYYMWCADSWSAGCQLGVLDHHRQANIYILFITSKGPWTNKTPGIRLWKWVRGGKKNNLSHSKRNFVDFNCGIRRQAVWPETTPNTYTYIKCPNSRETSSTSTTKVHILEY